MRSREELSRLIEDYIKDLPLQRRPQELYDPVRYIMEEGGKRLRPQLLMIVADMYGASDAKTLPVAAAVEVFHNFTLLHDDLMDNSAVRRGKPSVFKQWGQNAAILSGDAMVIFAYHLLEKCDPALLPPVLTEFNRMGLEVCEGQQFDMNFESRDDVTLDEYKEMIRLKTSVIFAVAAKLGGILAGAPAADCATLYEFGTELGLAFQIQDDYLDTYGDAEVLGKSVGDDIAESKKTFLAINALSEAGAATRRAILATFADEKLPLSHKISRIKTIYDSLDIPEITRGIVANHLGRALELLGTLSVEAPKTERLRELITIFANRNK